MGSKVLFWPGEISGNLPANLSANFDGKFFLRNFRVCFSRASGLPKKFTPKIHAQTCRHSSPISLSRNQNLFKAIFCLRGTPQIRGTVSTGSSEFLPAALFPGRNYIRPPPLFPPFLAKRHFPGRGVGVYILRPHAPGILYTPPLVYTPHP